MLGTKPIVFDETYRKMTEERFVYVVNSVEAMRADFPDLDLIVSLGCGSAINMPIVAGGEDAWQRQPAARGRLVHPRARRGDETSHRAGDRLLSDPAQPLRDLTVARPSPRW